MDYYIKSVQNVVEYIELNLDSEVSVAEISKISEFSIWHFQRVFSEVVGETIGSYLRRRRLTLAAQVLLSNSTKKIIDIALDYQFGSPEAFSRAFKKEFGVSPLQFIKNRQSVLFYAKPALDHKQIQYLGNDLQIIPSIKSVASIQVVGLSAEVISPLFERHKYLKAIKDIWRDFNSSLRQTPFVDQKIKVGVINRMAPTFQQIQSEYTHYFASAPYLAGFEELSTNGLQTYTIPEGTYAIFKAIGYHEQTQYIIDYVYSIWLPQSEFLRSEGPEFTWLDHHNQELNPETSIVEYYLPVKPKN